MILSFTESPLLLSFDPPLPQAVNANIAASVNTVILLDNPLFSILSSPLPCIVMTGPTVLLSLQARRCDPLDKMLLRDEEQYGRRHNRQQ